MAHFPYVLLAERFFRASSAPTSIEGSKVSEADGGAVVGGSVLVDRHSTVNNIV